MKNHNTNSVTETTESETEARVDFMSDHFDPALVFADPVTYLAGLGLRAELTEIQHSGFPAAA